MTFEEILPLMKSGKRCVAPSLSINSFYFVDNQLFVNDGLHDLPIYGLKIEYILATDWEVRDV